VTGAPASPDPLRAGVAARIDRAAADLLPAYFALVMATGIVSLAAWVQGFATLAHAMFWVNVGFFAALWALTLLRAARHWKRLRADVFSHARGVGFFTAVPAACVLGTQALLILRAPAVAWGLWIAGATLWALVSYTVFTALTVKAEKPPLEQGFNSGWLVSVVATQSVSVLASQLAGGAGVTPDAAQSLLFIALTAWLQGAMLYVWIISLIFYRYTFLAFKPSDLSPPYWINMGAMAISTLAGASLVLASRGSGAGLVSEVLPFIKGATLLFWATATWWIPMLLILGVWRHVLKRVPLRYDPLYWGAVFPLGMYSVATVRMGEALGVSFLSPVARAFFWAGLLAWGMALAGLARRMVMPVRETIGGT